MINNTDNATTRSHERPFTLPKVPGLLMIAACLALGACNTDGDTKNTNDMSAAGGQASAKENNPSVNGSDSSYIVEAYRSGLKEVELCDFHFKMITNQGVKDMAEAMIKAHSVTNKELQGLANKLHIGLPQGLSEGERKDLFSFDQTTAGPDFDRVFTDRIIQDHKLSIALYQEAADKAKDNDTREFFRKRLPELQGHLEMARQAQSGINNKDYSLSK